METTRACGWGAWLRQVTTAKVRWELRARVRGGVFNHGVVGATASVRARTARGTRLPRVVLPRVAMRVEGTLGVAGGGFGTGEG